MLNIKDYIRLKLTGNAAMELTDASNFGICSIYTGEFEPDLIAEAAGTDLVRLVPHPFLRPADLAGCISEHAAGETGLRPGTPVAAGLYDVSACALACGLLSPDTLCFVTGTWGIACFLAPEISPAKEAALISHTYLPEFRLEEESGATCTCNLDWFLEHFLRKAHPELPCGAIYSLCDRALDELKSEDCPLFLPYLYCCDTPADGGSFWGLRSGHGELHLLRSVMEGILHSLMRYSAPLRADAAQPGFQRIRISGGITQSQRWTQMLCDMLQLPLEVVPPQPGVRGAAICAGVCCGCFSSIEQASRQMVHLSQQYLPNPAMAEVYQRGYLRYQNALQAAAQLYQSNQNIG